MPAAEHRLVGVAGVALAVMLAPGAVSPAPAETPPQASEAAEERRPEPGAAYLFEGEPLEVTGELPAIPTSNTIASKLPLPLRDTPASVTVVPALLLEEQGATILGDALENVSGLNVQTGNGVYDLFLVRGFDSVAGGLILSDGAPELETTFYQLYNVERAEVFKGPTAFVYGGSPLAGTVNLVRKQPLGGGSFGRVGGGFGSDSTYEGTVDANLSAAAGTLAFRVNGLWRESDGYRDDKASDSLAVNPALTWRPDERHSLNLNLEVVDAQYRSDAGLPLLSDGTGLAPTVIPEVPRRRSYQSPFDLSDQQIERFQLDYEARLGADLTLRNKTYHRTLDWRSDGTVFNGVFQGPPGQLVVSRSLLLLDDRQELTGNQLEALWQVETGGVTHELLFGLELGRYRDRLDFDVRLLPAIDLFDPVETAPGSPEALFPLPGQALAADAESLVVAPYVVDQVRIGDRWRLLAGARFDHIDFDDAVSATERRDDQLSPMLGAVFAPTPETSIYASYGEAFAPPSTFTQDQDRVPEESAQSELGVKRSLLGGRAEATLAVYELSRDNVAIPDATGVLRQIGDQRSRGVELELRGDAGGGVRWYLTYAYTDGELTEFREVVPLPPPFGPLLLDHSGNTSPFTPEHIADLWVSKRFAGGFGVAGGARYLSEQYIDEDNAFRLDGYLTFDASASWDRGPWRLALNLENLTDEEYFTRGFGNTSVIPAPGFTAFGRFGYRF